MTDKEKIEEYKNILRTIRFIWSNPELSRVVKFALEEKFKEANLVELVNRYKEKGYI